MRIGETLNGYRVVTEPTNQSGGNCVWAFAEKDGRQWFIKEFLKPKYPLPDSPGSEQGKAVAAKNCRPSRPSPHDHEVARPDDGRRRQLGHGQGVFRCDATYYKVTEPVANKTGPSLHEQEPRKAAVMVRTLALSLKLLHDQRIVHGDLKPSNILVQQVAGSTGGFATSKLIDFDDSYFTGEPPALTPCAGTSVRGTGMVPVQPRGSGGLHGGLTCACDIFALGLVMHHS